VPRFSLWLPMMTCESAQTPERDKRWSYQFHGLHSTRQSAPRSRSWTARTWSANSRSARLGLHHTGLYVASLDEVLPFYRDQLGMQAAVRAEPP